MPSQTGKVFRIGLLSLPVCDKDSILKRTIYYQKRFKEKNEGKSP
uniref:Uncharacterized protein n=1 Tax=Arundo donax TaxID=35708 RepID=A0A0A9DZ85_ARUDO